MAKQNSILTFLVFLTFNTFSQQTSISIKPLKEFKFAKLNINSFNPIYGIETNLNVNPIYENGYYKFNLEIDEAKMISFSNESRFGIPVQIFIKPNQNLKIVLFLDENGIKIKTDDKENGNNLIFQRIYDSVVLINKILKENREISVEQLLNEKIFNHLDKIKREYLIDNEFEKSILNPYLEMIKVFFINLTNKKLPYFKENYSDVVLLNPNYKFWTLQNLEFQYFQDYLFKKINNNDTENLEIFINNCLSKYLSKNNSILNKIVVGQGLIAFFENYSGKRQDTQNRLAESIIKLYDLDLKLLKLKNYVNTETKVLDFFDFKKIKLLKSDNNRRINLNKVFTDKSKIYYIDSWASWCKPCIEGIPFTKSYSKKIKDFEVIFFNLDADLKNYLFAQSKFGLIKENSFHIESTKKNLALFKKFNPSTSLPSYQIVFYKNLNWNVIDAPNSKSENFEQEIEKIKLFIINNNKKTISTSAD